MSSSTVLTPLYYWLLSSAWTSSPQCSVSVVNQFHWVPGWVIIIHSSLVRVKKVFPLCCGARPSLAQSGLGNKSAGREIEIKPSSSSQWGEARLGWDSLTNIALKFEMLTWFTRYHTTLQTILTNGYNELIKNVLVMLIFIIRYKILHNYVFCFSDNFFRIFSISSLSCLSFSRILSFILSSSSFCPAIFVLIFYWIVLF